MKKVLGYCTPWSVRPGATVDFKVSTYGAKQYRVELVRVICGDSRPTGVGIKEERIRSAIDGTYAGSEQPIDIGSYAIVGNFDEILGLRHWTVGLRMFPTLIGGAVQTLVSQWSERTGRGLMLSLDARGVVCCEIGRGSGRTILKLHGPVRVRHWYGVTLSYDGDSGTLRLTCQALSDQGAGVYREEAATTLPPAASSPQARAPLLFAARRTVSDPARTGCTDHYNGKIERPFVAAECVQPSIGMASMQALQSLPGLVGLWDFARDIGSDRIVDRSGFGRDGRTVNTPSRAVKSFEWTGEVLDWRQRPEHYAAIHFHDDDLTDAAWRTSFSLTVPQGLRSGIYAAKLQADDDVSYLHFFVAPARDARKNRIALLASTATYIAYLNIQTNLHKQISEVRASCVLTIEPEVAFLQTHPEMGLSTYDVHSDGYGVRFSSRLRPVVNNDPLELWNLNADTHFIDWMEREQIEYDVITDDLVHAEGMELLRNYKVVMTGTHPEYVSSRMWTAFQRYLQQGGRLLYAGGNGFYWRIAFHPQNPAVIEVRRSESGARYWDEIPGESHLQFTGEYGALWRRTGQSPYALVGISTRATGFDRSSYYVRTEDSLDPRVRFMFEGIGFDERIGDFGSIGGGACGAEIDAANFFEGTPAHALVVARSEEHSKHMLLVPEETGIHHLYMSGEDNPEVRADIVFFETPNGGAVCSLGSINWAASLAHRDYENNVAKLTGNVLRRFAADEPFEYSPATHEEKSDADHQR